MPAASGTPHLDQLSVAPLAELIDLTTPVRCRPGDPTVHQVRAALDLRFRALLIHDPGTRAGDDPEELHQMRVAVRRMRATLRAARPLLDRAWVEHLRTELSWLGRVLGPVRDADVLLERFRNRAVDFDETSSRAVETLLQTLVRERETARAEMLAALDSDRYTELLRRLATAVSKPLPTAGDSSAGPTLVQLVGVEFRKLRKAVRRASADPPDEVLHQLRIQGKRLRYTGELAAASGGKGGKPIRKLVKSTVALQDVLGEHQDACVAQQRVRSLLGSLGDVVEVAVAFTAGRLMEREEASRIAARGAWPAAWQQVQRCGRPLVACPGKSRSS